MELTDNYQFNYQKLLKFLSRTGTDGYVFAMADDFRFISQINSSLVADLSLRSITASLVFLRSNTDVPMMQQIRNAATGSQALIIANLYDIVNNTKEGLARLLYLNFSREELRSLNLPVLFWADAASLSTIANHAPDLFSQRRFTTIHFTGKVEHPIGEVFEKAEWQEFAGTEKFKDIEAKITTLERRLHDAENTGYNKNRITNEIVLPLAKEYAELGITADKAENLLNKYEPHFDKEDTRQLQQLAEVYRLLHNYSKAIETLQNANGLIENKGNILVEWFNNINDLSDWMVEYGIPNDALEILEKAEHILSGKKDNYIGFNVDYALMLMQGRMGDVNISFGNIEKAKIYYKQCLEAGKRLVEAYPDNDDYKRETSVCYYRLGGIFLQLGDIQQAKDYFEQDLYISKQLEKNNPHIEQFRRDVSVSYEKLGNIVQQLGDLQQAKEYYDQSLDIRKQLEKNNPYSEQLKRDVSVSYDNLGNISKQFGDLQQAKEYYKQSLDIRKQLEKNNLHNEQLKRDVSVSYNKLGDTLQQLEDLQQAKEYYEIALNIAEQLEKNNPDSEQIKRDVAVSYTKLGLIEETQQHFKKALFYYNDTLLILKSLSEKNPLSQQLKNDIMWAEGKIAELKKAILQNPVRTNPNEKAE